MSYLNDFISLVFPEYCAACDRLLMRGEDALCFHCLSALPKTHLHDQPENKLERIFWGRIKLESATAYLKMQKKGKVHNMIHNLKYHDNRAIGVRLGELFGVELLKSQRMNEFDVVVPVPLHPREKAVARI